MQFRPTGGGAGGNLNEMFRQAVGLHQQRRLPEAVQLYRQILARQPKSAPVLTYCGAALLELGRLADATRLLEAATAADPMNADALVYLANARQMAGKLDEAEQAYGRALSLKPGNAQAQSNLGVLLQRRGRHEDAAKRFRKAVELAPGYAQAHNNLAQALVALGDAPAAIEAGQAAIAANPDLAAAHNTLGTAFSAADRMEEAVAAFARALEIEPDFLEALKNIAVAQIIAGRPADAVRSCDRALALDPGNVSALASKAVALSETGDRAALDRLVGLEDHVKVLRIDPGPDYAGLDAFNAALVEHILAHPTLKYEPAGHATRKGRHTGDLLSDPKGPFETFEQVVHRTIEQFLAEMPRGSDHPVVTTAPENWQLHVWSVVMEEAGHQIPHIHESGWLSGVYYPRVPADMGPSEDDPSGWIEFGLPQDLYRVTSPPPLRLIRPEEGLMILFPSFFFHRTVPTVSEQMRISIAFDVVRAD